MGTLGALAFFETRHPKDSEEVFREFLAEWRQTAGHRTDAIRYTESCFADIIFNGH
jgi:hypothetical protein